MKSIQGRNADLRTLAYPTLQSIAWKWKKCFHHICIRWKCSNKKSFMVFQNSRFFCLNFTLQVDYMANYQTSSEPPFWIAETIEMTQSRFESAFRFCFATACANTFWTTLTSFCVCIIAAKLSVKLLCCLKDKKQCQDCLSRADCYDQSGRRHTIK